MNFGFCASIIGIMGILSIVIRMDKGKNYWQSIEDYKDREAQANGVRKKSLEDLPYVKIPENILHMNPENTNEEIKKHLLTLENLSTKRMLNLTGFSNTDLKFKYGTANITPLIEYDANFTDLVTTLQKLGEELYNAEEISLATETLEYAILVGSDISKTYYLLSTIYHETGKLEKCDFLLQKAENLNTLMKDSIVRNLKASGL